MNTPTKAAGRQQTYGVKSLPSYSAVDCDARRTPSLPPIDRDVIPSYSLAMRAFSIVISGVAVLLGGSCILAFVITMSLTVSGDGSIEPARVWAVRPQESGVVTFAVRTGDTVHRGEVVATLDTLTRAAEIRALSAKLSQTRIDYERASSALPLTISEMSNRIKMSENSLVRARAVLLMHAVETVGTRNVDSLLVSYRAGQSVILDQAVADVRSAEADIQAQHAALRRSGMDSLELQRRHGELIAMQADIARAEVQRHRLTIVAPADGVILTEQLERRSGAFVQAGEEVLELGEQERWTAVALLADRDLHDVRVGQEATLEVPALDTLNGRQLRGRVTAVGGQPVNGNTGATPSGGPYRVTIALDQQELEALPRDLFRRGYALKARIVTRRGTIAHLLIARLRDELRKLH